MSIEELQLIDLDAAFVQDKSGQPLLLQIELDDGPDVVAPILTETHICPAEPNSAVNWEMRTGFQFFELPRGVLLQQLTVRFSVYQKNTITANKLLASMCTSLHTIATGPVQHELAMLTPDGSTIGTLRSVIAAHQRTKRI